MARRRRALRPLRAARVLGVDPRGEPRFTAASPSEFLDAELRNHPLWVAARELLERRGELEATRDRALKILETRNEDPNAFRVTSDYIVATARR